MTEKKDTPTFKLVPTAKEFIPKEKKVAEPSSAETREKRSGSMSLNIEAKAFVPKSLSPAVHPMSPPTLEGII